MIVIDPLLDDPPPDRLLPDELPPDTLLPDELPPDGLLPDELPLDRLLPDELPPNADPLEEPPFKELPFEFSSELPPDFPMHPAAKASHIEQIVMAVIRSQWRLVGSFKPSLGFIIFSSLIAMGWLDLNSSFWSIRCASRVSLMLYSLVLTLASRAAKCHPQYRGQVYFYDKADPYRQFSYFALRLGTYLLPSY